MKTVVQAGQTLLDIAVQEYGTIEASATETAYGSQPLPCRNMVQLKRYLCLQRQTI